MTSNRMVSAEHLRIECEDLSKLGITTPTEVIRWYQKCRKLAERCSDWDTVEWFTRQIEDINNNLVS